MKQVSSNCVPHDNAHCKLINDQEFGIFQYCLIFISGVFMASTFWETMGISYVLPVAECDLSITSKKQYGIVSGAWFAGMYQELYEL